MIYKANFFLNSSLKHTNQESSNYLKIKKDLLRAQNRDKCNPNQGRLLKSLRTTRMASWTVVD